VNARAVDGAGWFYSAPQVRRALQQRRICAATKMKKVQRAVVTPRASEWVPWAQELRDGHVYVEEEDLPEARLWFLNQGRPAQVLLKDSPGPGRCSTA
jgi:hypothetical protein